MGREAFTGYPLHGEVFGGVVLGTRDNGMGRGDRQKREPVEAQDKEACD